MHIDFVDFRMTSRQEFRVTTTQKQKANIQVSNFGYGNFFIIQIISFRN